MAETSMFWNGTTVGDATTAPYDAPDEFAQSMRALSYIGPSPNLGGVIYKVGNNLEPTVVGAVSPVNINTGDALVHGTYYNNSASVAIAIPNSAVSRYDRIVLRKSWAAQTVRITRIAGIEGGGVPALVQIPGTTWDVPIVTVRIQVAALTINSDNREFLPYQVPLVVGRQGGDPTDWNISGTNNYTPGRVKIQCGSVWVTPTGGEIITFPEAFSGNPLVVVTAETPGDFASCVTSSPTQAVARLWRLSTGVETIGFCTWIAIGPA